MLYSPEAVRLLEEGRDYMPARDELAEPLRALVADQAVVFLGTGSPQLDYLLHVHRRAPTAAERRRARTAVVFGLRIAGRRLLVRDGYDPMEWHERGESVRSAPLADGYHRIDALWLPETNDEAMRVHLFARPSNRRVAGDGWPYLKYDVRSGLDA